MRWGGQSCGTPRGVRALCAKPTVLPRVPVLTGQARGTGSEYEDKLAGGQWAALNVIIRQLRPGSICLLSSCSVPPVCSMMDRDQADYTGY